MEINPSPTGAEESKNVLTGVDVNTSKVHVGNSEFEESENDAAFVTVGVFFDGTFNNRANTMERLRYYGMINDEPYSYDPGQVPSEDVIAKFSKEGSYENDFSNVSRMEPNYMQINDDPTRQFSIYVEGIGSTNGEDDSSFWGGALGLLGTGVLGKVHNACDALAEKLNTMSLTEIDHLRIDTYGFSRGAAAARNFTYEVLRSKGEVIYTDYETGTTIVSQQAGGRLGFKLKQLGIEPKRISVRFVGLYDTVASYGLNHSNDTEDLHLDAISRASKVFQIAADDEHRSNFSLTEVQSAGTKALQKKLPGVHSDIGGGYTDNVSEELILDTTYVTNEDYLRAQKIYLIEQGWYTDAELDFLRWPPRLRGIRPGISNKYTFIPLQTMVKYSNDNDVLFNVDKVNTDYAISGDDLLAAQARINQYVFQDGQKFSYDNLEDRELIKRLRHGYFHFSAHYNPTYGLTPHSPNRENGIRYRETHEG